MPKKRRTSSKPPWFAAIHKVSQTYRRIFSIHEIEVDPILQWCLGLYLVMLFDNFRIWNGSLTTTTTAVQNHTYMCWQFFQNCSSLIFLKLPPEGISQSIFFTIFLVIIGAGIFFVYRKNWALAHLCAFVTYLARLYLMLISASYGANYWLYMVYFGFVFLCLPHKKFFGQLLVVMCYFLSTTSKISDAWILGTYFTSMQDGLPLIPHNTEIFFTNILLAMEMAGCWLLFSGNKLIQRTAFAFFVTFHIYSVLIVGQNFPSVILPWVVMLFGVGYQSYKQVPLDKKSWLGWIFMTILVFIQLMALIIPGDEKQTQEVGSFPLRMISSSNQARSYVFDGNMLIDKRIGPGPEITGATSLYGNFFRLKIRYCPSPRPLHFIYDHSVNGGRYYRIINQPDLCRLHFKPFTHNAWIGDESNSLALDYPRKSGPMMNFTVRDPRMKITVMNKKNDIITLNTLQNMLLPYLYLLTTMWWCLWAGLLTYLYSRFLIWPSARGRK